MHELISKKFKEWTRGKDDAGARISIFEHIRDIPYAILRECLHTEKGPVEMLRRNAGSCQPKHFLLEQMYSRMGITVLYVRYAYHWDEVAIEYPPRMLELARQMPPAHHLACKVIINDRLVLVDATTDPILGKLGLPVNEKWDGFSDTLMPITPVGDEEIYHPSERGHAEPPEFTEIETSFYSSMNRMLEDVREYYRRKTAG